MKTMQYFEKKDDPTDRLIEICTWINNDPNILEACKKHKRIKVTVERAETLRSLKANRFYWGVVVKEFQTQIWPDYSKEMVHNTLGEVFRSTRKPQEVIDVEIAEGRHKTEWFVPSTTMDNKFEFWSYVEQCLNAFFEAQGKLRASDAVEYNDIKRSYQ